VRLPSFRDLARAPERVVAYHGCHIDTAHRVLQTLTFLPSINKYDWLGDGIYFWEYAPHRAWEWAQAKFGDDGAVLKADIMLGHCLNLLDTAYFEGLQAAFEEVAERYRQAGRKLPSNRADKRHFLDRAIINEFCVVWQQSGGKPFQTVRGCFPEGEPVYQGSKILRETHVQIAVRDIACILGIEQVESA
jgi:hypothetical protein